MTPGYTVFFRSGRCGWWPADAVKVDRSGALWVLDVGGRPFAVFARNVWTCVEDGDRRPNAKTG